MSVGIACLTADDEACARALAENLDTLNGERRQVESGMLADAQVKLNDICPDTRASLCVLDEGWHQGIIGILAARLKESHFRPTVVFAPDKDGAIRGSGRSIPEFHLRDALDLVSKRHPDLIDRFGGHAAAAGLTIRHAHFPRFAEAFERVAQEWLGAEPPERIIETDGPLPDDCYSLSFAELLDGQVWGHGFPSPTFSDTFSVVKQRLLGEKHLSLHVEKEGTTRAAIYFNHSATLPDHVRLVFRPQRNTYRGNTSIRLVIEYAEPAG
jgi:single-stranded-DNA-specific exonuclease